MPEGLVKSYENAIKFLRDCQAKKANIPALQRLKTSEDGMVSSNYLSYSGSSQKREHHF